MLHPLQIYNIQNIFKVKQYHHNFTPFLPYSPNSTTSQSTQSLPKNQNFQNISLCLSNQGHPQYFYSCGSDSLEVVNLIKNYRLQFYFPHLHIFNSNEWEKVGQVLIYLKNHLLVLLYRDHAYVFDLIRLNYRLTPACLDKDPCQLSFMKGVCVFGVHETYVYTLEQKKYEIVIKFYGIQMENNFNVQKNIYLKTVLKISTNNQSTDNYERVLIKVKQIGHKLVVAIIVFGDQVNMTVHLLSKNGSKITNQKFHFVDEIVEMFWSYEQMQKNRLSNNWIKHRETLALQTEQVRQSLHTQDSFRSSSKSLKPFTPSLLPTPKFTIFWAAGSTKILFLPTSRFSKITLPKIFYHDQKILDICNFSQEEDFDMNGQGAVVILDYELKIWWFQLSKAEPIMLGDLGDMQNLQDGLRARIWIQNKQIFVCLDGNVVHMIQPLLPLHLKDFKRYEAKSNRNQTTPLFLSVQQSKMQTSFFCLKSSPAEVLECAFLQNLIQLCHPQPHVNLKNCLLQGLQDFITRNMLSYGGGCPGKKVQQLLRIVFLEVGVVRKVCFGGFYDCEDNLYYWVLLDIIESKKMENDLNVLVIGLIEEGQSVLEILCLVCSQHKIIKYLCDRSKKSRSCVSCPASYQKCYRLNGCSCPFKRLLKCLVIGMRLNKICVQNTNDKKIYKKVEKWLTVKEILLDTLSQSQLNGKRIQDKLESIANISEQKMRQKAKKRQNKLLKSLDEKWSHDFPIQDRQKISDFVFQKAIQISLPNYERKSELPITFILSNDLVNKLFENVNGKRASQIMNLMYDQKVETQQTFIFEDFNSNHLVRIQQFCQMNGLFEHEKQKGIYKLHPTEAVSICLLVSYHIHTKYMEHIQFLGMLQCKLQTEKKVLDSSCSSFALSNQSFPQTKQHNLLKKYWVLLTLMMCQGLKWKYETKKIENQKWFLLQNTLSLAKKSNENSRNLPKLALSFRSLLLENVIANIEIMSLMECVLKSEIHTFACHDQMEFISQCKFKYTQSIWTQGIQPILGLYAQASQI